MPAQPIKIAIMAMGGEGGGVLADWIVDLGEQHGYLAQSTSVPGVAQRTGATIYYVELYPQAQAEADGGQPVLALMPLPGDVDIVLASELMEAGRAVQRGLVTAGRTTLIASTHRVYTLAEKSALGDGRVDSAQLLAQAGRAARRFIHFDMAQLAERTGSVISAVLFGALAGSGLLPFGRAQFEATIARGGVGVAASLKAFAEALAVVQVTGAQVQGTGTSTQDDTAKPEAGAQPAVPRPRDPAVRALVEQVQRDFPAAARTLLLEGLRRLIDYQDTAYASLYLERLAALPAGADAQLLRETARHLALWMSYEDTARVAALKTRAGRFERVRAQAGVQPGQASAVHEFLHPRLQEVCETLPAGLGRWLMNSGAPRRLVERLTRKGRVLHSSSLHGYLLLRCVAWTARWRRSTLRYAQENQRIEAWLQAIADNAVQHPALALELAHCQSLVKGYSDTHERGLRNYDAVMQAVQRAGSTLAADTLRAWRDAALADEHGQALQAALQATPVQQAAPAQQP